MGKEREGKGCALTLGGTSVWIRHRLCGALARCGGGGGGAIMTSYVFITSRDYRFARILQF